MELIGGQPILTQVFLSGFSLQRPKQEFLLPVPFQNELNGTIAQVANPIKQNNIFRTHTGHYNTKLRPTDKQKIPPKAGFLNIFFALSVIRVSQKL
jgi:hypothetical protein